MTESTIIINRTMLTEAQATTVRVALTSYQMELISDPVALGDDQHGRKMRQAYLDRLHEIMKVMTP